MYHYDKKVTIRRQTAYPVQAGLGAATGLAVLAIVMLLASFGTI